MDTLTKSQQSLRKIVISHYLAAAFTFLVLAPMLFLSADDFGGHYFQPHLLAITHTAALGWLCVIVFGICYQFTPLIFGEDIYSYKLAWFALATFYLGLIDFVYSFWVFEPGLHMQCGSLLLLVGISSFSANIFMAAKKIVKPDIHQDFMLSACVWLLVTAVLGVLMVFNFRYAFLPQDHLLFLKLHAHAGLGGWFLLLIIGLSGKLLSLNTVSKALNTTRLSWSFYLINAALILFFACTYLFGITWLTYIIVLLAVMGVINWLLVVYNFFIVMISSKKNLLSSYVLLGFVALLIAIFTLPFIVYYQLNANSLAVRLTTIYGALLLFGWLSPLILGTTFKMLNLLFNSEKSQYLSQLQQSNILEKFNNKFLRFQFFTFLMFIVTFTAGVAFTSLPFVYAGIICFFASAVLYLFNVLMVLLKPDSTSFVNLIEAQPKFDEN